MDLTDEQRTLLFWCICFPFRTLFFTRALALGQIWPKYLVLLGGVTLIQSYGFVSNFASNVQVGGFGGDAWWARVRLLHASLYFSFALTALMQRRWAWIFLAMDAVVACIAFFALKHLPSH